jgi:hypothetical protein
MSGVRNDEHGVRTLVERFRRDGATLIVLEATSGYELLCVAALAAVPACARATGQLPKTARIDADILALFVERVRPELRALPDADAQALEALLASGGNFGTCCRRSAVGLARPSATGKTPLRQSLDGPWLHRRSRCDHQLRLGNIDPDEHVDSPPE